MSLPKAVLATLSKAQDIEITAYHIYDRLSKIIKQPENAAILAKIATDEKRHAEYWASITGTKPIPKMLRVHWFVFLARTLGLTFALKLLEKGENQAQLDYQPVVEHIPHAATIIADEDRHEQELIGMLNEERLQYIGSIVLGLNDALVELTGALAGLSFALQDSRVIGFAGLITGIAASLSMAASDYLSAKSEGVDSKIARRSALYTGLAYIITVALLVAPYLAGLHYGISLAITMAVALLIIAGFNYYISVAKDLSFKSRFLEMAGISLGVSAFTFLIGWLVRSVFNIEL
jgi:VIT1/CCC1 family predicted Fe2+/Mn2+ transporter